MTDRLISENALIKDMEQRYFKGKVTLRELIDEQPTAYNVDKVIEKLKVRKENSHLFGDAYDSYHSGEAHGLNQAIDIVKGGGIDEN
jgi:hypothetical protein